MKLVLFIDVIVMPIEHLLIKYHCLINENLHISFSFEMSSVTYSYIVPIALCLIKKIVDVLYRVIYINSQEGIGDSKAKTIGFNSNCCVIKCKYL